MKDQRLVSFQKRHEYYTGIYKDLHTNVDHERRIFTKSKPNFDFMFKNDKLTYIKEKEIIDFSKSQQLFKSFTKTDIEPKEKTPHAKLSFYLKNTIVPVITLHL